MSEILQGLLFCLIGAAFFSCFLSALLCRRSGKISLEEDYGAPEGALDIHHFQIPDASGSKLGVRASYQSVQSSGGG